MYIALYCAHIIYVHLTSPGMSMACTHLDIHKQHVSNGTWHIIEVMEIIHSQILFAMKTFIDCEQTISINILFKFPSNGEGYHLANSSLEVVMDKFSTLASPNCRNFILVSKSFAHSEMGCDKQYHAPQRSFRASSTSIAIDSRGSPKIKYLSSKCQYIF